MPLPSGVQLDWSAMFAGSRQAFIDEALPHVYDVGALRGEKPAGRRRATRATVAALRDWALLGDVAVAFPTLRRVMEVMNLPGKME
jgi:hypothetical protein